MLKKGEVAIVGYGSLISKESMEDTLLRPYNGTYKIVQIKGWKRTWNISHPNLVDYSRYFLDEQKNKVYPESIIYLNIVPDQSSIMNACLFVIKEEELAFFDEREKVYDRIDISEQLLNNPFPGQSVWVYVGKKQHIKEGIQSTKEAIVRQSYIEIVERGITEMGMAFKTMYEASTDLYPQHLVVEDFLE